MAPAPLANCSNCNTPATTRCSGCLDAPEHQPDDSLPTVYCSRECQISHRPVHKAHCRSMKQRKKLLRAAHVLKAAFLTYREVIYDIDLTKIDFRDGTLYLHQNLRSITARSKRGPFPSHLTASIEHREAALAINQCTTAMALLGPLTRKLLANIPSTKEVLDLHLSNIPIPTKLTPNPNSNSNSNTNHCPHTVIKVSRLFTPESWIIDTTGCQYGFRDVLVPLDKYLSDKAAQPLNNNAPTTYDATETKDLDFFATLPFMNQSRAQRENMKLERKARLCFADFVANRVDIADVLDGSDAEFGVKLDGLVADLKSHLSSRADTSFYR